MFNLNGIHVTWNAESSITPISTVSPPVWPICFSNIATCTWQFENIRIERSMGSSYQSLFSISVISIPIFGRSLLICELGTEHVCVLNALSLCVHATYMDDMKHSLLQIICAENEAQWCASQCGTNVSHRTQLNVVYILSTTQVYELLWKLF